MISIVIFIEIINYLLKFSVFSTFQKRINYWNQSLQHTRSKFNLKIQFVIITLFCFCFIQPLTYTPPNGLPNFEAIVFARFSDSPLSKVYQWTQQNVKNQKIYTIALRPYGLYNFPFSNRVIYGGDSEQWSYQNALDLLTTDPPDYLAIGRNPFNAEFPIALEDLLNDTQHFELVFGDPLAVVFRVSRPG